MTSRFDPGDNCLQINVQSDDSTLEKIIMNLYCKKAVMQMQKNLTFASRMKTIEKITKYHQLEVEVRVRLNQHLITVFQRHKLFHFP